MVSNRLLGNGWLDHEDFMADPHEISILTKNRPYNQSAMQGEHLSQKLTLAHSYNPLFFHQKRPRGIKFFLAQFCQKASGQNIPNRKKQIENLFCSRSYKSLKLCAAEFTHYNSDPA